ncbi:hypothetical protein GCM10025865_10540 [Paraoerskovia sediminicola]|uniref:Uncharacterized protein n=1 Tax=Paraoerskovia sediminicola TaxID=1138587 RepID=A0ABN6XA18_9CELL|nr:hypothetical protein [Paraoerskovia sediminicola]BDZ41755.1 hypothetical protein GCM10025865_10540 [Paraoerskovia sediminicola]
MNPRPTLSARARSWVASATSAALISAAALTGAVALATPASADSTTGTGPATSGTSVAVEQFEGATVLDPAWTVQGDTCLTGAPAGQVPPAGAAQIGDCSAHQVAEGSNPGPRPSAPHPATSS